jgi:hypothetical protein
MSPSTSDCAATWNVKNGVATTGNSSNAAVPITCRASRWRHRNFSHCGAPLSA